MQDELAETAIPDPGYAGTNAELDLSLYEYDLFEYWDDLEYGLDPYWDSAGSPVTGEKRKRDDGANATPGKRRKISLRDTNGGTAMFVAMGERRKMWDRRAPVKKGLKSFALLPDWRKRCADADTSMAVRAMLVEMRQAAEGNDEETPEGQRHYDAEAADDGEGEWEDDQEEDELDGPDLADGMGNVDFDTLKTVLRQKLGAAGLGDMSEDAFMETITKMLQGGGDADDAAGDLANSLLGTVKNGEDSGLSGWLSQQGVSLEEGEEDEDAESVATAEMPESSNGSKGKRLQDSPPDSAIEVAKGGRTVRMAMHDGSPKAGKKRLASVAVGGDDEDAEKKRKKVAFDVPASQQSEDTVPKGRDDGGAIESATSADAIDGETTVEDEPAAGGESPVFEPAKSTRAKTRAGKASTFEGNRTSAKTTSAFKQKAGKAKAEPAAETAGPASSTRKRKAEADEDEPPPAKKQTRKASGGAKNEAKGGQNDGGPSYARATRATRARSGK